MPRVCTGVLKSGAPCPSQAKLGKQFCGRHEPPRVITVTAEAVVVAVTEPVVNVVVAVAPPRVTVLARPRNGPLFLGPHAAAPRRPHQELDAAMEAALIADDMPPLPHTLAYVPDTAGTINTAAFAQDSQNVHRSSTLDSTHKCIATLLARPVPATPISKLIDGFEDRCYAKGLLMRRTEYALKILSTFERDCEMTSACDASYLDVARRVLHFIGDSVDPLRILVKEIEEGMGMCSTGKMCRLVNSIRGFDPEMVDSPPMTVFFERMSKLTELPAAERLPRARALFVEFDVKAEKQADWLELLED